MSDRNAIFAIIIGLITLGYSIPKLIAAFRGRRISIPGLKPFDEKAQPTMFWFAVASSFAGLAMAAVIFSFGALTLVAR